MKRTAITIIIIGLLFGVNTVFVNAEEETSVVYEETTQIIENTTSESITAEYVVVKFVDELQNKTYEKTLQKGRKVTPPFLKKKTIKKGGETAIFFAWKEKAYESVFDFEKSIDSDITLYACYRYYPKPYERGNEKTDVVEVDNSKKSTSKNLYRVENKSPQTGYDLTGIVAMIIIALSVAFVSYNQIKKEQ